MVWKELYAIFGDTDFNVLIRQVLYGDGQERVSKHNFGWKKNYFRKRNKRHSHNKIVRIQTTIQFFNILACSESATALPLYSSSGATALPLYSSSGATALPL